MSTQLPRRRIVVSAAAILLAALTLAWTFVLDNRQGAQIDALYDALAAEQQAAEDRGEQPVAPAPEELLEDPGAAPPNPVGPSDDQVLAAVEAYFAVHPVEDGEDASPAQITTAVVNYLTEHPPEPGEPGPAPTEEQVLSAVATYLSENPPPQGPQGPAGADGEDGHTPTSEEIQAELAAYLEEHPIDRCDPGWEYAVLEVFTTGPPTEITTCVRADS